MLVYADQGWNELDIRPMWTVVSSTDWVSGLASGHLPEWMG